MDDPGNYTGNSLGQFLKYLFSGIRSAGVQCHTYDYGPGKNADVVGCFESMNRIIHNVHNQVI